MEQEICDSPSDLGSRRVFLSAGIPEADWIDAPFQRHEITQAVVTVARAVLAANGSLVFGGHPLITPLVFDVAGRILNGQEGKSDRVILYQSTYFTDALPEAVWNFRNAPWASVNDVPGTEHMEESLVRMREEMIASKPQLAAAIFIGGKPGVIAEYNLVRQTLPTIKMYPFKRPGGASANLSPHNAGSTIAEELATSAAYWALARHVVADIAANEIRTQSE
jgi:hypothetical protein